MELQLLGSLEAVVGGERLELGGPVPRAIVAVLALSANQVVPSDRLAEAVWNGEPPATWTRTLQSYIARLRGPLGTAGITIETRKLGFVLVIEPGAIDTTRFVALSAEASEALAKGDPITASQRATEALALWRGPALADFLYADFAQPDIARLEEARLVTTEVRIEAELQAGRSASALPDLERLVAEHPLRERFRAQLMRALHWSGRTADALRVYQQGRRVLADELGMDPSDELQALEGAIIRNERSVAAPPSPADRPAGNMPTPITSFVGRQREVNAVIGLVQGHRLVTIVGPGGAGKTRLAVEVAGHMAAEFPAGAWFIDLAGVATGDAVGLAVARALTVPEEPGRPLADIVAAPGGKPRLLVLDNCEHVVGAARTAVDAILSAEGVCVLATSRQPLGLTGELAWPIPPMALPDSATPESMGAALQFDAVQLLVDRAAVAAPDLDLQDDDVAALLAICRQLDRLPLAIELAAGRLRALSPVEIQRRIHEQLFHPHTPTPATGRHDTLESVVQWSYELLDDAERSLFARLAVFAGSFTLDAVDAVCGQADLLPALVEKSLVTRADVVAGVSRYRLLQTLRSFAGRRLADAGEDVSRRDTHASYFVARAIELGGRLRRDDWMDALGAVRADMDDHRAAIEWLLARGRADDAARLVTSLWPYWHRVEAAGEARTWIDRVLDAPALSPIRRPDLLVASASAAYVADDLDAALAAADKGLREAGPDQANRSQLLTVRAQTLRLLNRPAEARDAVGQALQTALSSGDDWALADASRLASLLARDVGDLAAADRHGQRAVERWEACGDTVEAAGALSLLGVTAADRGDLDRAHDLYQRSLRGFRAAGDPVGEAHVLWRLAEIALERGQPGPALAFAQEAYRKSEPLGDRRGMGQSSTTAARALLALDEPDAADAVITMALGDLKAIGFAADLSRAYETAGWIALSRGSDRADESIARARQALDTGGTPRQTVDGLCLLATGQARSGLVAEARASAERAGDLARALVYPAGVSRSLLALATAAEMAGQAEEAALLRRAAAGSTSALSELESVGDIDRLRHLAGPAAES